MSDQRTIQILASAEEELVELQNKKADRNRAIALTHVQTALLWLNKEHIDSLVKVN
jgi:hypothetical protein